MHRKLLMTALAGTLVLGGCAQQGMDFGSGTEGTLAGMELQDLSSHSVSPVTMGLLGAVGGAILGQILGRSTSSTLAGMSMGTVVGTLGGQLSSSTNIGERLYIKTDERTVTVTLPFFSCSLERGRQVRLSGRGDSAKVEVGEQGRWYEAERSSDSDCTDLYQRVASGEELADASLTPEAYDYGSDGTNSGNSSNTGNMDIGDDGADSYDVPLD